MVGITGRMTFIAGSGAVRILLRRAPWLLDLGHQAHGVEDWLLPAEAACRQELPQASVAREVAVVLVGPARQAQVAARKWAREPAQERHHVVRLDQNPAGRSRQVEQPVVLEDAVDLGDVDVLLRLVADVLDHMVREDDVERSCRGKAVAGR